MQPNLVYTGVAIVAVISLTFIFSALNVAKFFTRERALFTMSAFAILFMACIAAFIILASDVSEFEGDPSCRFGAHVPFGGLCHPRYARIVAVGSRFETDTVLPNDAATQFFLPLVHTLTLQVEGTQIRVLLLEIKPDPVFENAANGRDITGSALLFKDQVISLQTNAGVISTWDHPVEKQRIVVYLGFLCAFIAIASAIRMTYSG